MKFVYFGYDHMLGCARRLIDDGHKMLGIFTFNCDNVFNFNVETMALGKTLNIPVILEKPTAAHIDDFIAHGCAVFIVAGFPTKVPVPNEGKAYAMNIHPSLLPKGRGLMPTPTILMHEPDAAGLSIHKLTEAFDAGDILAQKALPLAADETVDTYAARVAAAGPDMLSALLSDLPQHWKAATPQDHGQAMYFPVPDEAMRTLSWNMRLKQLDKIARAFGSYGCLCELNGERYAVFDLVCHVEVHDHAPGTIIKQDNTAIFIATADGVIEIKALEKLHMPAP